MTKKKALNTKLPKPYSAMSAADLDAQTEKFDQEFIVREGRSLTRSLQRKLLSARRKRGRPRVGKGSKRVLITLERGLLQRSDAFARRKRLSRSQLIALGLEALLQGR